MCWSYWVLVRSYWLWEVRCELVDFSCYSCDLSELLDSICYYLDFF